MNQLRVSLSLSRRAVPTLTRTTLHVARRTVLHSSRLPAYANGSWMVLIKKTSDHGAEVLVLGMYAILCLALMFRHLWKKSTGWEMQFFPTNKDLGDQFASSKQDWNDSRGQRTMGPLCRRHVMFFENKLGWKDDVKDLLQEIYSFSRESNVLPAHIVLPAAIESDRLRKELVIQNDQQKTTELMRCALEEVLAEGGNYSPSSYFYAKPQVMAQAQSVEETVFIEEVGAVNETA